MQIIVSNADCRAMLAKALAAPPLQAFAKAKQTCRRS